MDKDELPLCECGCGQRVAREGNRFINGHQMRGRKSSQEHITKRVKSRKENKNKPELEAKLCECGCGELANPGKRFIYQHQNRGRKHSANTILKIRKWNKENPYNGNIGRRNSLKTINKMKNAIDKHHYIYDHSDPSKYIIKLSKSQHARIHQLMIKAGIKIPHLNVTEENKDIFKGRK